MELLKDIQRVFDANGVKDSPLQILILAQIKATQDLLMITASSSNEQFAAFESTLAQLESAQLLGWMENLYGVACREQLQKHLRERAEKAVRH
jgi:hypothetical protein